MEEPYAASSMADDHQQGASEPPVLSCSHLTKTYWRRRRLLGTRGSPVPAVRDVSLSVHRGRTLAVVGESGSGKSTLARCLACLEQPEKGRIWLERRNLLELDSRALRQVRCEIQLVLQGAAAALNPRFSALDIVTEPLAIQGRGHRREQYEQALSIMESVGLPRQLAQRRPSELSGGQRGRLAIARALSLRPKVLILDESLAGLDLPVQAQIANLLTDLQSTLSLTYIFISHDLHLAGHLADDVAVMQQGCIVEQGPAPQVLTNPRHPHTQALLASVADIRADDDRVRAVSQ